MIEKEAYCPDCKKSLVEIDGADLASNRMRERDDDLTLAGLFNSFRPYVCPDCGFTKFYAKDHLLHVIHDMVIDQGGHG
jgi:RNase P subunit RPR2